MKVIQLTRKAEVGYFSIEGTFSAMRNAIKGRASVLVRECPHFSRGVLGRLLNIADAARAEGDIFHVLGDVHYIVLGLARAKTVLTIHDCAFAFHPNPVKRHILWLFWLWLPARRAARICASSPKTKAEIHALIDVANEKVHVIPVCISDQYQPVPRNFRTERPVVLQVGTTPNKNVARLIEALNGVDCVLHIVGKLTRPIQAALATSRVEFRHSENLSSFEMLQAYIDADVVAFVSTYEGFGMPIVEGNAVGRIVVTSNIEPLTDVAGGTAQLVDPYSVASIRSGIERVIHDASYRDGLITRGFENAQRFRTQQIADQYLEVYRELHSQS